MDLHKTTTGRVTSRKTTFVAGSETYEIEVFDTFVRITTIGQNGTSSSVSWKLDFAVESALCILKGMNRESLLKALISLQDFHPGEFIVPDQSDDSKSAESNSYNLGYIAKINNYGVSEPLLGSEFLGVHVDKDFLTGWKHARQDRQRRRIPYERMGHKFANILRAFPTEHLEKLICGLELIDWEGEKHPPLIQLLQEAITYKDSDGTYGPSGIDGGSEGVDGLVDDDLLSEEWGINFHMGLPEDPIAPQGAGQPLESLPDAADVEALVKWLLAADLNTRITVKNIVAGDFDGRSEFQTGVRDKLLGHLKAVLGDSPVGK